MSDFVVRDAAPGDACGLAAIYGHAVAHGLGTFEEVAPDAHEMERRRAEVAARGLPWLVALSAEEMLGFAYAAPFRLRSAYRYTVEDSVYVAPQSQGRGVGGALLSRLVARCEASNLRQMLAMIGDSGNAASRALHVAQGFAAAGVLPAAGFKHGRWIDVVMMTRELGAGASLPPQEPGMALT